MPTLDEIKMAISFAQAKIDTSDYYNIRGTVDRLLGKDVLAEKQLRAFRALPPWEQVRIETSGDFGAYGFRDRCRRPEVPLALFIEGRRLYRCFRIAGVDWQGLYDPHMVKQVTRRFPKITRDQIANTLLTL